MANISDLPNKGEYARFMRIVAAADQSAIVIDPLSGWVRASAPVSEIRRKIRQALDRRINTRGGNPTANEPIDVDLLRDARALDDMLQRRVRVYQFSTVKMVRRFGHLLARHDD